MNFYRLAWFLLPLTALTCRAEPPPVELTEKLTAVIRAYCPGAAIETTDEAFKASYSKQKPEAKSKAKTKPAAASQPESREPESFSLEVRVKPGVFGGESEVLEELRGKPKGMYLIFDYPPTRDGLSHYWISFSHNQWRFESAFARTVCQTLPKSSETAPEGRLFVYGMETQIGITARRTLANAQGKPLREIYYRLGTRQVAFVRFHTYDAQQRESWEGEYTPALALQSSRETSYGENGLVTERLTRNANGILRYKIIHTPKGQSHLQYDPTGTRVTAVQGVVPEGIDPASVKIIK